MDKKDFLLLADKFINNNLSSSDTELLLNEYFTLENKDRKLYPIVLQVLLSYAGQFYIVNLVEYFVKKFECTKILEGKTNKIIKIL